MALVNRHEFIALALIPRWFSERPCDAGIAELFEMVAIPFASVIDAVIAVGADLNAPGAFGEAPLMCASRINDLDSVIKLLDTGADVHRASVTEVSALTILAYSGHRRVVDVLPAGADVNHTDIDGATPLTNAMATLSFQPRDRFAEVEEIVGILVAAGANVDWVGSGGPTPLLEAAKVSCTSIANKLLAAGANAHATTREGDTPLMIAATYGSATVVQGLAAAGARIDHPNDDGDTALLCAAKNGHFTVVELLLALGANAQHRNKSGDTASALVTATNDW